MPTTEIPFQLPQVARVMLREADATEGVTVLVRLRDETDLVEIQFQNDETHAALNLNFFRNPLTNRVNRGQTRGILNAQPVEVSTLDEARRFFWLRILP